MGSFFTGGIFWFIMGILACVLFYSLRELLLKSSIKMTPWKWILVGTWVILVGFTFAFIGVNLGEEETTAAVKGGLFFFMVSAVFGGVVWRLLKIR